VVLSKTLNTVNVMMMMDVIAEGSMADAAEETVFSHVLGVWKRVDERDTWYVGGTEEGCCNYYHCCL
jgi:hypothetical protein